MSNKYWVIQYRDKFLHHYLEDYDRGELHLVDLNLRYKDCFYDTSDSCELYLNRIKENFKWIVMEDELKSINLNELEIKKVKVKFKIK